MGARGPKPRPTALRLIDGNPSKRPINESEPSPTGKAWMPSHLSDEAKKCWRRIMRAMPPGFYTPADEALLAAYCEAWSDHARATKEIAAGRSIIVKSGKGFAVSPLLTIRTRAAQTMVSLAARLGLSPADRVGLVAPAQSPNGKGKWDGLITS